MITILKSYRYTVLEAREEVEAGCRFIYETRRYFVSDSEYLFYHLGFLSFPLLEKRFSLYLFFVFLLRFGGRYGTQKRSNGAVDARAASVGSYVMFGSGYGGRLLSVSPSRQDFLPKVMQQDYCDYAAWCAGWVVQQRFSEMAFDRNIWVFFERIRRARETAVGAYFHR